MLGFRVLRKYEQNILQTGQVGGRWSPRLWDQVRYGQRVSYYIMIKKKKITREN